MGENLQINRSWSTPRSATSQFFSRSRSATNPISLIYSPVSNVFDGVFGAFRFAILWAHFRWFPLGVKLGNFSTAQQTNASNHWSTFVPYFKQILFLVSILLSLMCSDGVFGAIRFAILWAHFGGWIEAILPMHNILMLQTTNPNLFLTQIPFLLSPLLPLDVFWWIIACCNAMLYTYYLLFQSGINLAKRVLFYRQLLAMAAISSSLQ